MTMLDTRPKEETVASAQAVLESHFSLVSQPGAIDAFDVEGVDGWTSPNPHPALSIGRWTTDDPDTAAASLEEIVTRFREEGRGFDWMTGPRCAEHGLLPLLQSQGFINPPLMIAAMARSVASENDHAMPDGLNIWKVTDPSDSRIWDIMARGFDVPDDVAQVFHDAYLTQHEKQTSEVYAVSLDDDDTPVGVGYLSYIGDGPAVLMRVSSTLEEARGRGIYKALVLRRLQEAAKHGRTQAFVHAYSIGSQRCLEQLGFQNTGTLQLHRWRP